MTTSPYRLIHNPDASWVIAAKMEPDGAIRTLYEGTQLSRAFREILDDAGMGVPAVERKRCGENYAPKARDWETST